MPTGTMAHEWIMGAGQGDFKHNPAYCNWYALDAWVKEYGALNGTALTDTIGTDISLLDFQKTFCTLYSGMWHISWSCLGMTVRTAKSLFQLRTETEKLEGAET